MTKAEQLAKLWAQLETDLPKLPLGDINEPTVPGDGNPDSEIMFIGEAPGYYESVQRKPFVGRSGQLFTNTSAKVGFPRPDVYITNIVKVRPPENRDPFPAEILAYRPYLDQEIEIIKPLLIITLGRYSMAKFLPEVKISQVHGRLHRVKWHDHWQYILPMYHPAAALRNPHTKVAFEEDFQKIPKIIPWIKEKMLAQIDSEKMENEIKEALF